MGQGHCTYLRHRSEMRACPSPLNCGGAQALSAAALISGDAGPGAAGKYRRWKRKATLTSAIITGTSINGPTTAAKASPELIPNTATATAMASSKLLLAAVKASVVVFEYSAPIPPPTQ